MEYLNIVIAIVAFIVSLTSLILSISLEKKEDNRNYNKYLLEKIVLCYNKIEADIMLLDQQLVDEEFTRLNINGQVLLSLCEAKSKAKAMGENDLFDYLDSIFEGKDNIKMGDFIDDYFDKRDEYLKIKDKEERKQYCKNNILPLIVVARDNRDKVIAEVFKKVK